MKRTLFILLLNLFIYSAAHSEPVFSTQLDPCIRHSATGWSMELKYNTGSCNQGGNSTFIRYWVYLGTYPNVTIFGPFTPIPIGLNKVKLEFTDPAIVSALENGDCIHIAMNIRCCPGLEACAYLLTEPVFDGSDYSGPEERWDKLTRLVCPCDYSEACISEFTHCTNTYEIGKDEWGIGNPVSSIELSDNDLNYLADVVKERFDECVPPSFPTYTKKVRITDIWTSSTGVINQTIYDLSSVSTNETFMTPTVIYEMQGPAFYEKICHTKKIEIVWLGAGGSLQGGCPVFECETCHEVCFESVEMVSHTNNQSDYLGGIDYEPNGNPPTDPGLSTNNESPYPQPDPGNPLPSTSNCIADWTTCANTEWNKNSAIRSFDDMNFDYLIPAINQANSNSPCLDPMFWNFASGARVTDTWEFSNSNFSYTKVFTKDIYGIPVGESLDFPPFDENFSFIENSVHVCHTKTIELLCQDKNLTNPNPIITRPYISCEVCMDICLFPAVSTSSNFVSSLQGKENNDLAESSDLIRIYPNPANRILNLEINSIKPRVYSWKIIDMSGRVLLESNFDCKHGTNILPIDINQLAKGIYTMQLRGDQEMKSVQVFIND